MSINTPPITPQQYEVLHGGGAEAAEIAKQRLSRRRFLRRSMLAVYGLSATASSGGFVIFYVPQSGRSVRFRSECREEVTVFPAAKPENLKSGQAGVFYVQTPKHIISHLAPDTQFSLSGSSLR